MKEIRIDEDFKSLLPPLSEEERAELEKDISANGVYSPLILWNETLVDGHNRYEICTALGIEDFPTIERNFGSKSDAMQWIIDNQKARRNLKPSEMVQALAKVEAQMRAEANELQRQAAFEMHEKAAAEKEAKESKKKELSDNSDDMLPSNLREAYKNPDVTNTAIEHGGDAEETEPQGAYEENFRETFGSYDAPPFDKDEPEEEETYTDGEEAAAPERPEEPAGKKDRKSKETAVKMAKKMGVSENTYRAMKTVVEQGTDEEIARMDKGGKGNGASKIAQEIKERKEEEEGLTKECPSCGRTFPLSKFGRHDECPECRKAAKEAAKAEKERDKELMDGFVNGSGRTVHEPMFARTEADGASEMFFEAMASVVRIYGDEFPEEIMSALERHISRAFALKEELEAKGGCGPQEEESDEEASAMDELLDSIF